MKMFKLLLLMALSFLFMSCMKDGITVKIQTVDGGILAPVPVPAPPVIVPVLPPAPPTSVAISVVPNSLSESAVFNISHAPDATSTEVKILKKSDNSIVKDWEVISSGGSVSGLTLDPNETYYAVFRSQAPSGVSTEVTSSDWTPVSNPCVGAHLTNAPYASGTGTIASPYLICTKTQFAQIEANTSHWSSHFRLLADIDLTGVTLNGIGSSFTPFKGTFDGNGKTIENLSVNSGAFTDAGIFNIIQNASIRDLTIRNSTFSAALTQGVGLLAGSCYTSQIKNITLTGVSVEASGRAGALVGSAQECTILDVTASGSVKGTNSIGGVVGSTFESILVNVTSTVMLDGETNVGGLVGYADGGYYQRALINSSITGTNVIGGIFGTIGSEVTLNRSSFTGSITATEDIGGIIGVNNGECDIAIVKSDFTLNGVNRVGGAIGAPTYPCRIKNISLKGTINSTTGTQIGGFYGVAYTMPDTEKSLAEVNLNTTSTLVGGFIGESQQMPFLPFINNYNAIIANVTAFDGGDTVSLYSGYQTNDLYDTTSYYWSGGVCDNATAIGDCNTTEGQPIPLLSTFYDKSSAPYVTWNFPYIWQENASSVPSLLIDSVAHTFYSGICSGHAFVGIPYSCTHVVDNSEGDFHEFQTIAYEKTNTCSWLNSSLTKHQGIPTAGHAGDCVTRFYITDGTNKNSSASFNVTVHDELSFSPVSSTLGLFLKSQGVSAGQSVKTVTITNSLTSPVSISIMDPFSSEITRTGGTCGASIPASGSCTLIIGFDPSFPGTFRDYFSISYTTTDGTFHIPYWVYGYGV